MKVPSKQTLFNTLCVVVLLALVLPFAVTAVPQLVGADQSYTVLTGSMQPAISSGDVIIVRDVPASTIETGDVITYELDSGRSDVQRQTHRVVEVVEREDGRYFRTKGDANEDPDQRLVSADTVVGRVMMTIPYAGHVTLFANTTTGIVVLILVPTVLLIGSEVWMLISAVRKSRGGER
ncbi:signal peptidase I [Haloferax mediterranei ATCC 33500]|uniref:Peptidase S26B, signal peptidase n=1 Tax=Haloferax mediterranei (strain ATCC 33500 / DSM 1411 / JCM 8866 / NBRC 14739 / NCIMB 2177 / R-4) TaxID=523841 RepID=I3R1U2_HALMT|nr:signal peptidase I [Haloferax mediterranei]AFK18202.1 signal peptidase I [Haloferax mediterranei ATCC 33500]AHZ22394.1 peptidase S26B, signal peptidase [Haloferax mediterranei ATCC 33500]EMA02524.1 signal peptidase I [Haloferax mediterranei ATCC 33500]MDX5988292.1 signal peptidase I [Haloferax mediterranei ATCC 33500]QCQ74729.1 signal peptidase I [Haloferax mediterranei ATCC 33500]